MQIEKKGSGPWPNVAVDGVRVTLIVGANLREYDCAALQGEAQVTVDVVRTASGKLAEGVANGAEYVANLIIPPARYADVPLPMPSAVADEPEGAAGDTDPSTDTPGMEQAYEPLCAADMAAVRLILWTISDNMEA